MMTPALGAMRVVAAYLLRVIIGSYSFVGLRRTYCSLPQSFTHTQLRVEDWGPLCSGVGPPLPTW
jgi:hypothetical protein